MNRDQWIRNRAYQLWKFRNDTKIENTPVMNWLDAEWEWETFYKERFEHDWLKDVYKE